MAAIKLIPMTGGARPTIYVDSGQAEMKIQADNNTKKLRYKNLEW